VAAGTVQIRGIDALIRDLNRIDRNLGRDVQRELQSAAKIVSDDAKSQVRQAGLVDSGRMVRSIRPRVQNRSNAIVEARRSYFRRYYYPALYHFGTWGTRPSRSAVPFLYIALERKQAQVVRQLDEMLGRLVDGGLGGASGL
jgi:phage gpG-like protein